MFWWRRDDDGYFSEGSSTLCSNCVALKPSLILGQTRGVFTGPYSSPYHPTKEHVICARKDNNDTPNQVDRERPIGTTLAMIPPNHFRTDMDDLILNGFLSGSGQVRA
jgi:hypothetical protein